jgi:hypothetical protein
VKKCQLNCYVSEEEYACISVQAAKRRLSLSRYMKERLLGEGQQPHPQVSNENGQFVVLEALFRESEQRISQQSAAAADDSFREVLSRLRMIATMLDQLARTMLIHTPEIAKDQQERAGASGERRHRNWQRVVADLIKEMDLTDHAESNGAFPTEVAREGEQ